MLLWTSGVINGDCLNCTVHSRQHEWNHIHAHRNRHKHKNRNTHRHKFRHRHANTDRDTNIQWKSDTTRHRERLATPLERERQRESVSPLERETARKRLQTIQRPNVRAAARAPDEARETKSKWWIYTCSSSEKSKNVRTALKHLCLVLMQGQRGTSSHV